jgi:GNAT superfamily N-acetyltransferase
VPQGGRERAARPVGAADPPRGRIRPARPAEAASLSELALRSKAVHGHDPAFLAACAPDLTVTPQQLSERPAYVWDEAGRPLGFYVLKPVGEEADLAFLFVDPAATGRGIGRALFEHAVRTCRYLGVGYLRVEIDPNAEGFYRRMGARPWGTAPSPAAPGRLLPVLRLEVRAGPD